jgi:predicted phosphohydrolase
VVEYNKTTKIQRSLMKHRIVWKKVIWLLKLNYWGKRLGNCWRTNTKSNSKITTEDYKRNNRNLIKKKAKNWINNKKTLFKMMFYRRNKNSQQPRTLIKNINKKNVKHAIILHAIVISRRNSPMKRFQSKCRIRH